MVKKKCDKCGQLNLVKCDKVWACAGCGSYVQPTLSKTSSFQSLQENLKTLVGLHVELKSAILKLEDLVRE